MGLFTWTEETVKPHYYDSGYLCRYLSCENKDSVDCKVCEITIQTKQNLDPGGGTEVRFTENYPTKFKGKKHSDSE